MLDFSPESISSSRQAIGKLTKNSSLALPRNATHPAATPSRDKVAYSRLHSYESLYIETNQFYNHLSFYLKTLDFTQGT